MITDAKLGFVFPNSPLSLVAAAGVDIPTSPYDMLGNGPGTAVTNIYGNSTLPGQADAMGVGGERPELFVVIGTALVADTGTPTLNVQLQAAADDGSNNPSTYQVLGESGELTVAQCTANQIVARLPWLPPFPANLRPRFIRLNFAIPAGTNLSAGTIKAALVTTTRDDPFMLQQPANYTAPRYTQ